MASHCPSAAPTLLAPGLVAAWHPRLEAAGCMLQGWVRQRPERELGEHNG